MKLNFEIASIVVGLQLIQLYDALDNEERPFSCCIKKANKGIRWIVIRCRKEDVEHFEAMITNMVSQK